MPNDGNSGTRAELEDVGIRNPSYELRKRWELSGSEIVHRCPPKGSGLTPCCDKTMFELPSFHRVTLDPKLVTCKGPK